MRATHGMLISTHTGRAVSESMLRDRYEVARAKAALKAETENRPGLAAAILSMYMRDIRKRAADLAGTWKALPSCCSTARPKLPKGTIGRRQLN